MLERRSGAERVSDEERVLDHSPASGEVALLIGVQRALARPAVVKAARGLSHFGEHSAGWFALGLVGAAFDSARRKEWLTAAMGAVGAHAASIAVKRVVRRRRPGAPRHHDRCRNSQPIEFPFVTRHVDNGRRCAVLGADRA
jgi:hypothetical protein